jgi:hypothetical protein
MEQLHNVFEFLSKKENILEVLKEFHPEAINIYNNFMDENIVEFYANLSNDMKAKFLEIINNKINNK